MDLRARPLALSVLLAACSADTAELELRPGPSATPTPTPTPSSTPIHPPECTITVGEVEPLPWATYTDPPFVVDGARIAFTAHLSSQTDISRPDLELFTLDAPRTRPTVLDSDPADERLIDARHGRILFLRQRTLLEHAAPHSLPLTSFIEDGWRPGGAPPYRLIGDPDLFWPVRGDDYGLVRQRGTEHRTIDMGVIDTVDVEGTNVAWLSSGGRVATLETAEGRVSADIAARFVVTIRVSGAAAHWATDEGLMRLSHAGLESLSPSRCTHLVSSEGTLAAACVDARGPHLLLVRGDTITRTDVDHSITALAISPHLVAWMTHDIQPCGVPQPDGALQVHTRAGATLGRLILDQTVLAPCWCCSDTSPAPYVALSDQVVVSNYDAWSAPAAHSHLSVRFEGVGTCR